MASGSPGYADGREGKALLFDGSNTVVTLPPNVAGASGFTFAAWVYWRGGGNWQRIFDFGNSTTEYLFLTPRSSSGTLRFAIKNGGSEQIVETASLPLNEWSHVAITLGGTTARLYVNGTLAASNSGITISPGNFSARVNFLGKSQFAADPLFNGMLDEVVIADTSFAPGQIAALQANSAPEFGDGVISLPEAMAGQAYSESLESFATDSNGDPISYSKVHGPSWLAISASGMLSGIPNAGDGGTNYFIARATDPAGTSSSTVLAVSVKSTLGEAALLAHYALDGNATDRSGNAFHAAISGGATFPPGRYGSAVDLNGATAYLTVPPKVLESASDFTIAAWVNWDGGGAWQRIFDFGNGTAQYLFLTPSSGSGTLRFAIKNGGVEQIVETSALPTGQWRHVAITLSGTTARLYVDGVIVRANNAMSITPASIKPRSNFVGKSQFSADPLFNGRVDEMFLFNYALAPAAIERLMSNQPPPASGAALEVSILDGVLVLSWPSSHLGSRLETNYNDLANPAGWSTVPGSESTQQLSIPIDPLAAHGFFRLVYP